MCVLIIYIQLEGQRQHLEKCSFTHLTSHNKHIRFALCHQNPKWTLRVGAELSGLWHVWEEDTVLVMWKAAKYLAALIRRQWKQKQNVFMSLWKGVFIFNNVNKFRPNGKLRDASFYLGSQIPAVRRHDFLYLILGFGFGFLVWFGFITNTYHQMDDICPRGRMTSSTLGLKIHKPYRNQRQRNFSRRITIKTHSKSAVPTKHMISYSIKDEEIMHAWISRWASNTLNLDIGVCIDSVSKSDKNIF